MAKLDAEQKIKQLELDKSRELTEEKIKHIEEVSAVKTDANTNYYNKMTDAFTEIQLKGDKNTQFVQEMAMKIFDRVPTQTSRLELDFHSGEKEAKVI
jgi:hypothetical protein